MLVALLSFLSKIRYLYVQEQDMAGQAEANLSFDKIWELFQEIGRKQAETARHMEETDRQMKETDRRMEETARHMKETDRQIKETAKQMKETDKRVGELTNRFGDVVEHMVVPNLVTKFNELGYKFTKSSPNVTFQDFEHDIFAEADAYLENGDCIMIVETKVTPNIDDVKDHIERMEKIRRYADFHNDKRKYFGAIAGVVMNENIREYILKQGFYAVVPSGETFSIISPKDNKLREW
jgi:seryl-tRNA synthetase